MLKSLSLTVDAQGQVLVAGAFEGSLEFGGKTLTGSSSGPCHFLAKLDGSGRLLWCNGIEAVGNAPSETADEAEVSIGAPRTPSSDGAFTWMQDHAAEAAAAPAEVEPPAPAPQSSVAPAPISFAPPPLPQDVAASSVIPPAYDADVDRDSFEPVWVADDADGRRSVAAPAGEWSSRLGRAFGYSLGVAGVASAVGVLALALMQPPEAEAVALVPAPVVQRSLAAGSFADAVERPAEELSPPLLQAAAGLAAPAPAAAAAPPTVAAADDGAAASAVSAVKDALAGATRVAASSLPADTRPEGTPAELRAKVVALLVTGQYERALAWSHALVAAEPDHALSYLCLGATLLDLGRAAEARAAFAQCVERATRGDAAECAALGGGQR